MKVYYKCDDLHINMWSSNSRLPVLLPNAPFITNLLLYVYYFDRKRRQNMRTTHHFLSCLKKTVVSVIQSLYLEYQVSLKEHLCYRRSKVKVKCLMVIDCHISFHLTYFFFSPMFLVRGWLCVIGALYLDFLFSFVKMARRFQTALKRFWEKRHSPEPLTLRKFCSAFIRQLKRIIFGFLMTVWLVRSTYYQITHLIQ